MNLKNPWFVAVIVSIITGIITYLAFACRVCINILWMNAAAISLALGKPNSCLLIAIAELAFFACLIWRTLWKIPKVIEQIFTWLNR
jgi:hypothetical protein